MGFALLCRQPEDIPDPRKLSRCGTPKARGARPGPERAPHTFAAVVNQPPISSTLRNFWKSRLNLSSQGTFTPRMNRV